MSPSTRQFLTGVRDGLPFHIVIWPFAAIFGAIAAQAGLNVAQVMGFSVLMIAGSAQLTALQLMTEQAPTVIVILTALAVNLRAGMYSASITPHLGKAPLLTRAFAAYLLYDQPFALSSVKFEEEPELSLSEKLGYFFGVAIPIGLGWYAMTLFGALLGDRMPSDIGLEFAVPITFLAVIAPLLKSLAHLASAVTAMVLALVLDVLPFGTGLLVAACVALFVGAGVETWVEKRKARR
ncbi:AzlC family ABC transporter permease [Celeribacter indicus]|uniref:AzlC family protein n=1 Tax=Celeribacter indicus TaxID=1208324 RepID=A0A0B5E9H6_9RHOB|nr:AzlC family ABC transporter permease [Celeribacter indicus]AJE48982.1 AzlC family protein [Celeribacter indicus]SDW42917.1 Predicted branched-chain amino acid permease (azaleucine resistance) [Celeribacter indicus]